MLDAADVQRIALCLPEVTAAPESDRLSFAVCGKAIAWTYLERVKPKAPRQPRLDVLAVRCTMARKDLLIEMVPDTYFDDDHYRGFPAVLVRLATVDETDLGDLLREAWMIQAPKRLLRLRKGAIGGQ